MTTDLYAGAASGWAEGATLVYGPIAHELVGTIPHRVAGRLVLDAGAGTGFASEALRAAGARVVATDLSPDMLGWRAESRPPAVVADLCDLPFATDSVDDTVAAFVLNHLPEPGRGLAELARVTRPGGVVVASVFATAAVSPAREALDEAAVRAGWIVPQWYLDLKESVLPLLGTAELFAATARRAGLADATATERSVDVGVETAEDLVEYRLGQAQFAPWLQRLGPRRTAEVKATLVASVRPVMAPYRPLVVFLTAVVPAG